jgi:hypothetical protein
MRDLTRVLEGLSDELARAQREISVLEQIGRELTAIVDGCGGAGTDALFRRHLDEIALRTAAALAKQTSIARMMQECGRERSGAKSVRMPPVRRMARPKPSFAPPIAGQAESL